MKRLAAICALIAAVAGGQGDTEILPGIELSVMELTVQRLEFMRVLYQQIDAVEVALKKLTPAQLRHLATALNRTALFEAHTLSRLTRHRTSRENYLYYRIAEIRNVAKTDPDKAEQMINAVVEYFRQFGVEL
ncbi:MAG: hypothetical protein WC959_07525 [Kiritimatiellales bacterium]